MFKVGDRVRRKNNHRDVLWSKDCYNYKYNLDDIFTVDSLKNNNNELYLVEMPRYHYMTNYFELVTSFPQYELGRWYGVGEENFPILPIGTQVTVKMVSGYEPPDYIITEQFNVCKPYAAAFRINSWPKKKKKVKKTIERWVNIYQDDSISSSFTTFDHAVKFGEYSKTYLTTVKLTGEYEVEEDE